MGLTSLPILNRIGNYTYWNNVWDSNTLFKRYLFLSFFFNKFFNIIFIDYTLNILNRFLINKNIKKGYINNFKLKKNIIEQLFLGKIWIFKYQNWYIIVFKLFLKSYLLTHKKSNVKKIKNLFKYINYTKKNLNYKYNFS